MTALLDAVVAALWNPGPTIAVQRFFGPAWLRFFQAGTLLGDTQVVMLVILLAFWLRGRRLAYGLLGILLLGGVTNELLWHLFTVPRPHDPRLVVRAHPTVPSFPSGHTVTATIAWGTLVAFAALPTIVAAVIVGVVMLSRLYLGVHYLGDVLGGLLIGLVLVAFHRHFFPAIARWYAQRSFRFVIALGVLGFTGAMLALRFIPPGRWGIGGAFAGAAVSFPLEYHYVRFSPATVSLPWQGLKAVLGLAGLVPLLLAGEWAGDVTPVLSALLFALATLWGVLVVPALFVRLGFSRHAVPSRSS